MSRHVTVPADPDQDDCLAAAELTYKRQHPALFGYDLAPAWTNPDSRETVTLAVPTWFYEQRDPSPFCNCGTCTPGDVTCVRSD